MASKAPADKPVAILGAGALGRLWGSYLPPGQAWFVRRESSVSPDTANPWISYQLRSPEAITTPRQIAEKPVQSLTEAGLLLVTTKAGDTWNALEMAIPYLPDNTPIVLFQNGMGLQQSVANRWPERPVLAASTTEGANRPDRDTVVHAGRGQTWIGGLNAPGRQHQQKAVERLAETGLAVHPEPDIHQRLWDKLAVNAGINAFTAILDCPNGDILENPFFLDHIHDLSAEIAAVMATDTNQPLSPDQIRARIRSVARSTAHNTSSMRSDVHRRRKTEIDVINGYIVARGREADIPTPVNQMLVRQVKDLEPT